MFTRSLAGSAIHGALAGAIGSSCMTVLRMVAHRHGWVQQMVPQAVEAWVTRGLKKQNGQESHSIVEHHVRDQLLHLGYGASWGAAFGSVQQRVPAKGAGAAIGFGLGLWAFGSLVLFPALRIGKPAWRSDLRENAVNVSAHLLYATVTAFLVEEFGRQAADQPRSYGHSRHARVG